MGKLDHPATPEQLENLIRSVRVYDNSHYAAIQLVKDIPAVTTQIYHPARTRINNIPAEMGRKAQYGQRLIPEVPAQYESRKLCKVRAHKLLLFCFVSIDAILQGHKFTSSSFLHFNYLDDRQKNSYFVPRDEKERFSAQPFFFSNIISGLLFCIKKMDRIFFLTVTYGTKSFSSRYR